MNRKIVIVGGVAGGMSAATRARRVNEGAQITVLEKGGFISFANCGLPYYLAGRIQSEDKLLVTTVQRVKERFNINARVHHEVTRIDRKHRFVEATDLTSGRTLRLEYDKLILAPGATPIVPPIDNVRAPNVFLLRSMEDTQAVQRWLTQRAPKRVAIVGAGFIGLEMAEAMRDRGLEVTLIEKAPHVLPPLDQDMSVPVAAELTRHGVVLITGNGLGALHATNGLVSEIELEDERRVPADLVLLSIGVRPNVKLAQAAFLEIGPTGGIMVDEVQRTSDPDIYAVGDAAEAVHGVTNLPTRIPLAGPANRQGRTAGEHAASGNAAPSGKVIGTAIVQVFDLAVGTVGLGERTARAAKLDIDVAYVLPAHHAGYYPGARTMRMKLIYERPTGRIIGAQVVGGEGVDKRLDVIATAIHFRGTVDDLTALDLAYAPQFGSAKDPIHMAGFVAQNQRRGLTEAISPLAMNQQVLVDVRSPEEYAKGTLRNARNIPVDQLRTRLNELDPSQPTVVFCQVGQRGYLAQRILRQHGFADVKNLKGGYTLGQEQVGEKAEARE